MTYVWVLSRGQQHEGGNVVDVYGGESAANTAFINAAEELRLHWTHVYNATHQHDSLEDYLQERTEIQGDESKVYYCSCDYIALRKWQVL